MKPLVSRLRLILVFAACLLLSSCSTIKLAYNNLNWLIIWKVEDYVSLDEAQTTYLEIALAKHLDWHCQTQLPGYIAWLDTLRETVDARAFGRERIAERYDELISFLMAIGREITPTSAKILASLSDDQVRALFDNIAQRNRDRREEYLQPPLSEQISQRAERLEERLERWFGTVSVEQQEMVMAWARQRGDQNQAWLSGREQWQAALAGALQDRQEPGFAARLGELIADPDQFKSVEYRAAMAMAEVQSIELAQRLLAVSSERQLAHLRNEIVKLRSQLQRLSCD